jgi:toxin ParE1/3/4
LTGRYQLTPKAEQDLRSIWQHIAADNESAADRLLLGLFDKFELAANNPQIGPQRAELSATARLLFEGNYIIIYEPQPDGVLVVAIVHGMRDSRNWLGD